MRPLVFSLAIAALLAACAGQLPRVTPQMAERAVARWPQATPATLETGRVFYVQKCSGCHNLRLPNNYPSDRWPALVEKMAPRAKITPEEQSSILQYLVSASATH